MVNLLGASVLVRRLDLRDAALAEAASAVSRAAYLVEAELLGVKDMPPAVERAAQLRGLGLRWLGAFAASQLVGVVGYQAHDWGIDLRRLAVDPRCFRHGVASRLIAELPPAPVITVRASTANPPALAFYARHGFVARTESILPSGLHVKHLVRRAGPDAARMS